MKMYIPRTLCLFASLLVLTFALSACTDDDDPSETTMPTGKVGRIYLDENGITVKCNDGVVPRSFIASGENKLSIWEILMKHQPGKRP